MHEHLMASGVVALPKCQALTLVYQMKEDAMAIKFAALDEGPRTAECSGGIRRSSPNPFVLNVSHAREKEFAFLIFKGGKRLASAFLAQRCGSDFLEPSMDLGKAAARFGTRLLRWWCSASAAPLETIKFLLLVRAFATSGSAGAGGRARRAFKVVSSASRGRFGLTELVLSTDTPKWLRRAALRSTSMPISSKALQSAKQIEVGIALKHVFYTDTNTGW
jgi:hypothetical protein